LQQVPQASAASTFLGGHVSESFWVPAASEAVLGHRVVLDEKGLKPFGYHIFANVRLKINYDFHRNPIMQIITIFS
jgi:hypothetical protein